MVGLPKMSPREAVDELRELAREMVDDMNEDRPAVLASIGIEPFKVENTAAWSAADILERYIDEFGEIDFPEKG